MDGKMVPVNPNSMVPVTTNQIMTVGYDTMDFMRIATWHPGS